MCVLSDDAPGTGANDDCTAIGNYFFKTEQAKHLYVPLLRPSQPGPLDLHMEPQ